MRRAAASVPSNLAEGGGRSSDRDYARFVSMAQGSIGELSYQTRLAEDLKLLDADTASALREESAEVGRMLHGLRRKLLIDSDKSKADR